MKARKSRIFGDPDKRAEACTEFASNPLLFRFIDAFSASKIAVCDDGEWRPSKSQMSRDMTKIFGKGWAARRRAGSPGRGGGESAASTASGLDIPPDAQFLLEPSRKPSLLSSSMEHCVLTAIKNFEVNFGGGIITPTLIRSVAMENVLSQLPNQQPAQDAVELSMSAMSKNAIDLVMRQLESIAKKSWLRSFLHSHRDTITRSVRKRALEQHKAAKHQVELVLGHLRNVYQAESLAQIQRHIASTGQPVRGFVKFENIVQRDPNCGIESTSSLLEVRDGLLYVKALGKPLDHVATELRFALDKTPINPDSPMLKAYTAYNFVPLSRGRASIWTLLPVLCGNGTVISSLLIQRCQSVPVDAVKLTAAHSLCVSATENAHQSDESWLNFAKIWLPLCKTSFQRPGFVYIDGHTAHVTRSFIQLAAKHGVYVIVEPSHKSMILQVADVGINRFLKMQYEREYTASLCSRNVTGRRFDDTERIFCVVRTLEALKTNTQLIADCFEKSGLLSGYNDVASHFPPTKFNAGVPLRDLNLPQVSHAYTKAVLSIGNLGAARGAPVVIPNSLIDEKQRLLREYAEAGAGFRKFYFALGASAETELANGTDQDVRANTASENDAVVSGGVRKLFKLGCACNVPRGAPVYCLRITGECARSIRSCAKSRTGGNQKSGGTKS